jgi:hypothetical protein
VVYGDDANEDDFTEKTLFASPQGNVMRTNKDVRSSTSKLRTCSYSLVVCEQTSLR